MSLVCVVKPFNYLVDKRIDLALAAKKFSSQSEHENPSNQIAKSCNVNHSKKLVKSKKYVTLGYATLFFSPREHKSDPMPTALNKTEAEVQMASALMPTALVVPAVPAPLKRRDPQD